MMKSRNEMRSTVSWSAALLAVAMLSGGAQAAPPIGDVEFVRGAGAAQRPGQAARVLGSGSPVEEG